jgi:hypothetical protein
MKHRALLTLLLVLRIISFPQGIDAQQPSENYIAVGHGMKVRLALQTPLNTKLNEVGDPVRAVLYDDLLVDGHLVLNRGTEFLGLVTHVKPAGRPLKQSQLALTFNRVRTSYGLEEISTVITAIDDAAGDRKLKGDNEGVVTGGRSGGKTVENIYKGATIGSAGGLAVVLLGKGSGGAATAGGATILGAMAAGVLLTKGEDIKLMRGTILRIQFERPITLPVLQRPDDDQENLNHDQVDSEDPLNEKL